jgi:hypothetical protein
MIRPRAVYWQWLLYMNEHFEVFGVKKGGKQEAPGWIAEGYVYHVFQAGFLPRSELPRISPDDFHIECRSPHLNR